MPSQTTWQTHSGQISSLAPLSRFRELPFAPEMVVIPPGNFMMGSPQDEKDRLEDEGPQHEVTVARAFAVGRFPVTIGEYLHFCKQTGRHIPKAIEGDERHPVVDVDWDDAKAYAEWLSGITGAGYRLLSEVEWEYCCRAGTVTRYSFGNDEAILGEYAWYAENSSCNTHPVGEKKPNPWGLYDFHGNVFEWVEDKPHMDYVAAPAEAIPWGSGCAHIVRGGSWGDRDPAIFRSAFRGWLDDYYRDWILGFRIARTLLFSTS
jgi:formylglycine-generating enzyme required for sulfatase activity